MFRFDIIDMAATGNRIKDLVKQSSYSVDEISGMLFVHPQAIYKWIYGKALPTLQNLLNLAKVLRVKPEDIIIFEEVM